jgi:ribosomal protein L30E
MQIEFEFSSSTGLDDKDILQIINWLNAWVGDSDYKKDIQKHKAKFVLLANNLKKELEN